MKALKNNLILIVLGFILAFGVVYIFNNTNLLQASILSISDYKTIKKNNRDIAYKTQNDHIEVFCLDSLEQQDIQTVQISLVYDDIVIDWGKADYQNSINISTLRPGETNVNISNIGTLDCKESIIDIPFSGNYQYIIVNKVITIDSNNREKYMKIGNLNTVNIHGN